MKKLVSIMAVMLLVLIANMTVLAEPVRDMEYMNENKVVIAIDGTHFIPGVHGWAFGVTRQIIRYPNGSILELDAGEGSFTAQLHDYTGSLVFTREISFELPLFGAFHSGEDYNFALFGQNNMDERVDIEVFRIVRFDKQWNRIDDIRLYGGVRDAYLGSGAFNFGDVARPFVFGAARLASYGDLLVLHIPREMYHCTCGNGTPHNHQSALYMFVDIPNMSVMPSRYHRNTPWFSHSLNQFPIMVDGLPTFLDHGTAFPRTIGVYQVREWEDNVRRYYVIRPDGANWQVHPSRSRNDFYVYSGGGFDRYLPHEVSYTQGPSVRFERGRMLEIPRESGSQFRIAIGGFGASSEYFIASAGIAAGFRDSANRQRDIYVLTLPRDFERDEVGGRIRISTFYGTDRIASVPVMTQVGNESFVLMWEEYALANRASLGFVVQFIDGRGQPDGAYIRYNSFDEMVAAVLMTEWLAATEELATPGPSGSAQTVMRFAIGSTRYYVNGERHTMEAAPFMSEGRTMVPLRVIAEALGATDLDMTGGVITFSLEGRAFTMTVGQPLPGNMGEPVIIAGRTFVPLRYIIEEMGAATRWDSAARAAYVYVD
ncbi:MAG: copper amine oxidase N-terminal domain-containing protein [Defluviitaleaceae bacterium]|nr:copper amine oxidase N-terminal domain-containing protein [Defluviitaleaceae bacterium]